MKLLTESEKGNLDDLTEKSLKACTKASNTKYNCPAFKTAVAYAYETGKTYKEVAKLMYNTSANRENLLYMMKVQRQQYQKLEKKFNEQFYQYKVENIAVDNFISGKKDKKAFSNIQDVPRSVLQSNRHPIDTLVEEVSKEIYNNIGQSYQI